MHFQIICRMNCTRKTALPFPLPKEKKGAIICTVPWALASFKDKQLHWLWNPQWRLKILHGSFPLLLICQWRYIEGNVYTMSKYLFLFLICGASWPSTMNNAPFSLFLFNVSFKDMSSFYGQGKGGIPCLAQCIVMHNYYWGIFCVVILCMCGTTIEHTEQKEGQANQESDHSQGAQQNPFFGQSLSTITRSLKKERKEGRKLQPLLRGKLEDIMRFTRALVMQIWLRWEVMGTTTKP